MLDWIRARTQIIILSDTFEEFAGPLMAKLGYPALLCHNLTVDNVFGEIEVALLKEWPSKRAELSERGIA
jgi:phosphoserine/homoserine phosphotransferase